VCVHVVLSDVPVVLLFIRGKYVVAGDRVYMTYIYREREIVKPIYTERASITPK